MGRTLLRTWRDKLADVVEREHLARRQFSVATFLGLVETEVLGRVRTDGRVRKYHGSPAARMRRR